MSHCTVDVHVSAATATNSSSKWTALKLQQSTTTDATNATDISGAVGTTNATTAAGEFVLGVHNDDAGTGVVRFHVNLANKERYLRVEKHAHASHSTTMNVCTFYNTPLTQANAGDQGATAAVYV